MLFHFLIAKVNKNFKTTKEIGISFSAFVFALNLSPK